MWHYSEREKPNTSLTVYSIFWLSLHHYFTPPCLKQVTSLGSFLRPEYKIELVRTSKYPSGKSECVQVSGQRKTRVSNKIVTDFRDLRWHVLSSDSWCYISLKLLKRDLFLPVPQITRPKLDYQWNTLFDHLTSVFSVLLLYQENYIFCENNYSRAFFSYRHLLLSHHVMWKKDWLNN